MGYAEDNLSYYVLPGCEISSVSYMECADNKNDNFDDDTDAVVITISGLFSLQNPTEEK